MEPVLKWEGEGMIGADELEFVRRAACSNIGNVGEMAAEVFFRNAWRPALGWTELQGLDGLDKKTQSLLLHRTSLHLSDVSEMAADPPACA